MEPKGESDAAARRFVHDEMRDLMAHDRFGEVAAGPVDRDDRGRYEDALFEWRWLDPQHLLEPDVETRLRREDIDVQPVSERPTECGLNRDDGAIDSFGDFCRIESVAVKPDVGLGAAHDGERQS